MTKPFCSTDDRRAVPSQVAASPSTDSDCRIRSYRSTSGCLLTGSITELLARYYRPSVIASSRRFKSSVFCARSVHNRAIIVVKFISLTKGASEEHQHSRLNAFAKGTPRLVPISSINIVITGQDRIHCSLHKYMPAAPAKSMCLRARAMPSMLKKESL